MNKPVIHLILLLTVFTCCSGKKILNPNPVDSQKIVIETNNSFPVKEEFFSFNTANLFTFFSVDNESLINKISEIRPSLLRFPGGTVANFYHLNGKGYGFRRSDIQTREGGIDTNINNLLEEQDALRDTFNFIKRFIPLAKKMNVRVIYVANILNAEVSEAILAIQMLQSSGLEVAYVELGNEFYLNAYKNIIPDASVYLKKAKPFAEAIRKQFPKIKLSVPAEAKPNKTRFSGSGWDETLSGSEFYDAVSIHVYPDFRNCASSKSAPDLDCFSREVKSFLFETYPDYLARIHSLYKNKPLLITEWNIAKPNRIFGNTMLHGIYTALFQLENMKLHTTKAAVQLMCFHNLASKENAYSLLTPDNIGKPFPPSINYAVFKMLSPLAKNAFYKPSRTSGEKLTSVKIYTFQASGEYHAYVINTVNTLYSYKGFTDEKGRDAMIVSSECLYGVSKNLSNPSMESFQFKSSADPYRFPPYSLTHVKLKF